MDHLEEEEGMCRIPPVIRLIQRRKSLKPSRSAYQASVLILTFIAYACYHASRKPSSIVKSVFDPQTMQSGTLLGGSALPNPYPWPLNHIFIRHADPNMLELGLNQSFISRDLSNFTNLNDGWAPFNGKDGASRLGEIDVAFLAVYSLGMYFVGHLGDRLDLRKFLTIGMLGSGTCVALFGLGYWWNVHNFYFYLAVQTIGGLFQATGWPSVVAVVGNWFGKKKRGLIMGIWNAHTSIGNICGSLIAAGVLQYGWGWSFVLPGAVVAFGGVMVYLFLVVDPKDVGFSSEELNAAENEILDEEAGISESPRKVVLVIDTASTENACAPTNAKLDAQENLETPLLQSSTTSTQSNCAEAIGFIDAWKIPGVAPFAMCLFFSKLVAYTFLYWLPFYISHTAIAGEYLSDETAGNLSTLFDVGGVVGGILAGHISDKLDARAITAASFMYCAIPALILYRIYGSVSLYLNVALMMIAGLFVNGPYALITTAVSADLGTHSSLKGNSRALATVTAIIDGTGSVGAALGPLLTGFISGQGWNNVFTMLMLAAFIAGLLLTRLVIAEIWAKIEKARAMSGQRL
eukprot:Gb_39294 [translate_table: standard]